MKQSSQTSTTKKSPLNILIVTSDVPSHPYAAAKLAKILAKAGHMVTLAAPKGPALDRIRSETLGASNLTCISAGTVSTKKHVSERQVVDPLSWKTLWNNLRHPFSTSVVINNLMDCQEDMYQPICDLVSKGIYGMVIPMHSIANTVCDAVEATKGTSTPVMIFSSLPYDPALYLGERKAWNMPRSLTIFPHVACYSSKPCRNPIRYLLQLFWKLLDAWLSARMWAHGAIDNNRRRAKRGLGPIEDGWRGYLQQYPVLTFGGTPPFLNDGIPIASNVTAVGTLDVPTTEVSGDLKAWLEEAENGIIYAGFGTGTTFSNEEASNLTGDLIHNLVSESDTPRVLWALRASEQKRLRQVIDAAMSSSPTSESADHLEYLNGRLRIQADVPQSALLLSGHCRLFVSHMGMGAFAEGVQGGVPFIAYPSGGDQWANAQRAVDAGIAIKAPYHLKGIGDLARCALRDDLLSATARDASKHLKDVRRGEGFC